MAEYEPFRIVNGKIKIYDVPTVLNNTYIQHKGGTYAATQLWQELYSATFAMNERKVARHNLIDWVITSASQPQ